MAKKKKQELANVEIDKNTGEIIEVENRRLSPAEQSEILADAAFDIFQLQYGRIKKAALAETADGITDEVVSKEIALFFDMMKAVKVRMGSSFSISATGEAAAELAKQGGVFSNFLKAKDDKIK